MDNKMTLETYGSLEEKEEFFGNEENMVYYKRVDTSKKLKEALKKIEETRARWATNLVLVIRGVSEAKYKLYTSAQREWMTNEWWLQRITFPEFVGRLLDHIKTDFIEKYFQSMGVRINHLLLLSFLQHYRAPSPLLDFTTDPNVALFFALEHMQGISHGSQDIENYFSIYTILMDKSRSWDVRFSYALEKVMQKRREKRREDEKNGQLYKNETVATAATFGLAEVLNWLPNKHIRGSGLCKQPILFLTNPSDTNPKMPSYLSWSNPNIIAQKGCFLLNTHEKQPLEKKFLEEKESKLLKNAALFCLDIHKSLAPYIREEYLRHNEITKETIYPDFNAIANEAYEAFKRNPTAKISLTDLPDSKD